MHGCLSCSRYRLRSCRSTRSTRSGGRLPGPLPPADPAATESDLRVFLRWCTEQDLDPLAAVRVDIERYLRWLQDVRPPPALHRVSAAVRRGRLLPRLRHRRDPAALAGRLRAPADGAGRVTDARAWPPTVRSADHHRPPVGQRQRLRSRGAARPARATHLRSVRRQRRRPGRGARPPGSARARQGRQDRPSPAASRGGPRDRPSRPSTARSIARATAGGSGTRTTLPRTRSTRWPCSSPRSVMLAPHASKIRSPSRPRSATRAKSLTLADRRAVVISASNCR